MAVKQLCLSKLSVIFTQFLTLVFMIILMSQRIILTFLSRHGKHELLQIIVWYLENGIPSFLKI
jgi:hypothetical protein